jgi:Icc-related predicted phosphoesterase
MPYPPSGFRKTRIVCVSDTHNTTSQFPKGDVFIHAGDLTNQGSLSELQRAIAWIEKAPYEVKIIIAGNHDITLDSTFYSKHGRYFHNQNLQSPSACQALLQSSPSITYLNHNSTHIKLTNPEGPHTHFRVFGSPYSPEHGLWAFAYKPTEAAKLWAEIPANTDILVTHTPPATHCDASAVKGKGEGCEALRQALWRVRPKLHVCGHKHEGRGAEKVRWNTGTFSVAPTKQVTEERTEVWVDPGMGEGNRKMSLVDLTGRTAFCLDSFDSGHDDDYNGAASVGRGKTLIGDEIHVSSVGCPENGDVPSSAREVEALKEVDEWSCGEEAKAKLQFANSKKKEMSSALARSRDPVGTTEVVDRETEIVDRETETIVGKLGRRETCVVNAAILVNSWGGRKRFNKPIVVDIDLPVWREGV